MCGRLLLVAGLLMASVGCLVEVDYTGSEFTCETADQKCPEGQVCDEGLCRDPADLVCSDDWFDCAFSRRVPLTFANFDGGEDLASFPALIRVSSSDIDYDKTNDDGSDIRIATEDGTELPFEIERWDETGESIVWVQIPTLAAGGVFFVHMYYGNVEATAADSPSAVWDANYAGVWHLAQSGNDMQIDSTVNANLGAPAIGMDDAATATGLFGGALDFDGVDDWVQVEHSESLATTQGNDHVTLEAWAYMSDVQAHDVGLVVKTADGSSYDLQLGIQLELQPNFRVRTEGVDAPVQSYLTGASVIPIQEWHYIAGVYNGAEARVYLDAVLDGSTSQTGVSLANTEPVLIGRRAIGDERYFLGLIDEVRISNIARTDEWLAATYRSLTGQMLSIGAEERRY